MDKQQAMREAFVEWLNSENSSAVKLRGKVCPSHAAVIWQAAQDALMPSLVEARDALELADGALAAANAMLPYGGQLLSMAHASVDKARPPVSKTLARINAIIGDKK